METKKQAKVFKKNDSQREEEPDEIIEVDAPQGPEMITLGSDSESEKDEENESESSSE